MHEPENRPRGQQGGFTLVEVLVTMTITVIGLVGLLSLHMATVKGNQIASRTGAATTIAQKTIEELRAMPVDDSNPYSATVQSIVSRYGVLPITNYSMTPETDERTGMAFTRHLWVNELTSMSEDLIRIRVEVSWADDGADPTTADESLKHSIALEIVRTRQEAL